MPCLRRWIGGALTALCLTLPPASLRADALDRMQTATLAGSERLRLRAFGQALSTGRAPDAAVRAMKADLARQGYYHTPGAAPTHQLWVAPVLAWDGNINGGVLQDRFTLNGLEFQADPAFRAKAGLVFGASGGALLRQAWAEGRLVEVQASGELAWSPAQGIGSADLALSACSRNHLAGWSFLDLCAVATKSWRELGDDTAHRTALTYAQVIGGAHSLHEVGLTLASVSSAGGNQGRVTLAVESVWNRAVTEVALTVGAPVAGATVLRQRVDLGLAGYAAGRRWRLDLWGQTADGSQFLGTPRQDRAWGIGLATDLRPGTRLRIGYADSRSTAAIATYEQVTLDLRFDRLRW